MQILRALWAVYNAEGYKVNNIKRQYIEVLAPMIRQSGCRKCFIWNKTDWQIELLEMFDGHGLGLDMIWVFDVIDHTLNPIYVLFSLTKSNYKAKSIFITHTYRAIQWFWGDEHFHEMHPKRFKRLLDECGFEIVQMRHKVIWRKWYEYLRFRTFLRLLFGWQHFYAYEIRLKK